MRAFLVRGFVGGALLKGLQVLLTLGVAVFLARSLGPEGYGIYTFALSLSFLLAIPSQMGLPTLMVREVARYQLQKEWGCLRGLLRWANGAALGFSMLLVLCAAAVGWFFVGRVDERTIITFALALILTPLAALGNLRGAALGGLRKVLLGLLPEKLLRPAFLLLLAGLFSAFGTLTAPYAMGLHALAAALAFIVGAALLLRALPPEVHSATPAYETRAWLRSILPLSLISGMQVINQQADIILLGLLATTEEVGIYRVAYQGSTLIVFAHTLGSTVILPQIARLYHSGQVARLQRMITWSARGVVAASLPIVAVFVFFGEPILALVFGGDYAEGHVALAILCVGRLAMMAMGPASSLLNMTGHERDTARGVALAAACNVALNVILIPLFGMDGAAVATVVSLVLMNTLLFRFAKKVVGIDTSIRPFRWGRLSPSGR